MVADRLGLPASGLIAVLLLAAGSAMADDAAQCPGFGEIKHHPDLAMGRIVGSMPRVHFVKSGFTAQDCPDASATCRDAAYLVPGNAVIASEMRRGFTCVSYVGTSGDIRSGWIPTASVAREPAQTVRLGDWVGRWIRAEATLAIKTAPGGRLAIDGEATFGALDPDRVKSGAINVGEIDDSVVPDGGSLAFDEGDKGTLPVDKGDANDCKIWMLRLGPYLLVDDDGKCGGWNVTFRGLYRRKA